MLEIVKDLRQLPFMALMQVYSGTTGRCGPAEQEFYQYLRQGFFTQPEDCYCLWLADEKLVSALRLQSHRDGLLLEALETHPDYRRQGHGEALVRAAVAAFPGRKIYVHIENRNKPSILLHKKCGFIKISDMAAYADGSVNSRAGTYVFE